MVKEKKVEESKINKEEPIVIEETEDDVLATAIKGDPDDFKTEVKKEAEKGRAMRIFVPIFFFIIIGSLIGFATWYYNNQNKVEEPKKIEEKIQTPPEVTEDLSAEPTTDDTSNNPTDTTNPDTPTSSESSTTTGDTVYTVKSGDTLSGIANAHDMTSKELADYNNITDPESLQIGQKLKIPN